MSRVSLPSKTSSCVAKEVSFQRFRIEGIEGYVNWHAGSSRGASIIARGRDELRLWPAVDPSLCRERCVDHGLPCVSAKQAFVQDKLTLSGSWLASAASGVASIAGGTERVNELR